MSLAGRPSAQEKQKVASAADTAKKALRPVPPRRLPVGIVNRERVIEQIEKVIAALEEPCEHCGATKETAAFPIKIKGALVEVGCPGCLRKRAVMQFNDPESARTGFEIFQGKIA